MSNNNDKNLPQYGEHGIIYPSVWRFLSLNKWFSPSMWLPKGSAIAIDIYLMIWWVIEIFGTMITHYYSGWRHNLSWILYSLLIFRIIDISFVVISLLIKGSYRPKSSNQYASVWISSNRVVLHTIFNALEIMFIFGVLFFGFSALMPKFVAFEPALHNLFESLYLSVMTATTLGYVSSYPTSWLSRLLIMFESSFILLVLVMLITYARSGGNQPIDKETLGRTPPLKDENGS